MNTTQQQLTHQAFHLLLQSLENADGGDAVNIMRIVGTELNQAFDSLTTSDQAKAVQDRLDCLNKRWGSTNILLSDATAEARAAEAEHFRQLAGNDEFSLENARETAIAKNNAVNVIRGEITAIDRLVAEAKTELAAAVQAGMTDLYERTLRMNQERRHRALGILNAAVQDPEFVQALTYLFVSEQSIAACGCVPEKFRQSAARVTHPGMPECLVVNQ
ncbi:MAG: hypothetical protein JWM11_3022 [Planctomycetaceae bacterium]|nr:hypothetical protein [Planctomycetaceae bacterium]